MPLNPSTARKRQTQNLRRRIQNLTRYEPNSVSSDDDRQINGPDPALGIDQKHGFLGFGKGDTKHGRAVVNHAAEQSLLQEMGKYFSHTLRSRY